LVVPKSPVQLLLSPTLPCRSPLAQQLFDVLMLHRESKRDDVHLAVERALSCGCISAAAVTLMVRHLTTTEQVPEPLADVGHLAVYGQPAKQDTSGYQQLLGGREPTAVAAAAASGG